MLAANRVQPGSKRFFAKFVSKWIEKKKLPRTIEHDQWLRLQKSIELNTPLNINIIVLSDPV